MFKYLFKSLYKVNNGNGFVIKLLAVVVFYHRMGSFITECCVICVVVNGRWTSVRTKISHGGGEPGRDLISKMRKDLRFESQGDFERFIECILSSDENVDYLRTKNIVRF